MNFINMIKLDNIDKSILQTLQTDGRISNQDLAERIGLSPTPCARRVKHLEESGLIQAYCALLNPEKLGLNLTAYLGISMDRHTPERFENFETLVASFPEVLECFLITGSSADYLLKVIVKDMDGYQQFLLGKLTRIEGVSGVHSSFVMRRVVDSSRLPL